MLALTRKIGEPFQVGAAFVVPLEARGNRVVLGILAPKSHKITRLREGDIPETIPAELADVFVPVDLMVRIRRVPLALGKGTVWEATFRDLKAAGTDPMSALETLAVAAAGAYGAPKDPEAYTVRFDYGGA